MKDIINKQSSPHRLSGAWVWIALLLLPSFVSAQVGIGIECPHPSAQLHIESEDKGLLIPRMTYGQRNSINNAPQGLLVYQTNNAATDEATFPKGLYYHTNEGWVRLPNPQFSTLNYASGKQDITLRTSDGGVPALGAALGFGNSYSGINVIATSTPFNLPADFSFIAPSEGVITEIAARFKLTAQPELTLFQTIQVYAQLYSALPESSIYTPIEHSVTALSPVLDFITPFDQVTLTAEKRSLEIPVIKGQRLMFVLSAWPATPYTTELFGKATGYIILEHQENP